MFGLKIVNKSDYQQLIEAVTMAARQLEDTGWLSMSTENSNSDLFPQGFQNMLKMVRLYYTKNPLAGQWVNLTNDFVFGEGISTPKCKDDEIQKIVSEFWEDVDNQVCFTSSQAQKMLSTKLQIEGNLFFALFTDELGNVRIRLFNTEEILDIIRSTEDRNRPLFYKVSFKKSKYNFISDSYELGTNDYIYYPDKDIFAIEQFHIPSSKLGDNLRIFHVKINCDINDKFGIPELYRGIDWMKAHKDMAGDLATLIRALSQFAWKKKVKGNSTQVNAIKTAMNTKNTFSNARPAAGSTQIENESIDMQSVKVETGGAQIGKDGMRQMLLQVCAASGIPEHYFGDPSTSNLATSKTLELPVVKKFLNHQQIWIGIYNAVLQYVIDRKIEVGEIPGEEVVDQKMQRRRFVTNLDRTIDVDFPPILDEDLKLYAEAIKIGKDGNMISDKAAARMFMQAAKVANIEQEIEDIDFTRMSASAFGQSFPGQPKEDKPVKETIEIPEKPSKLDKKNNMLDQRMRGYRKALAGNYKELVKDIKEGLEIHQSGAEFLGNIHRLDVILDKFADRMKESAKAYFPIAIQIGREFLQSHLTKAQIKESVIKEVEDFEGRLLSDRLAWNDNYVRNSLSMDIKHKVADKIKIAYDSEAAIKESVAAAVSTFESRIEQYVGAFWTVEEMAVKEAGRGTDVMVNFGGADDDGTCQACNDAMAGNPYPIDQAPVPGTLSCGGRCRHALQIITN